MNDMHLKQPSDKRVCERTDFSRKVLVELMDGRRLECVTSNVSLGGILATATQDPGDCKLGDIANLFLLSDSGLSAAYPCKIARLSNRQLGLELDRKSAARFGKELTKGMFVRK